MKNLLNPLDEIRLLHKIIELAAEDYYRGCKLVPNQRDDLIQGVMDEWREKAKRLLPGED